MESEPQQIDLETFLGVLDREQLQALVVSLIVRDPTGRVFDMLEQATEFLDQEQLLLSLEPIIDVTEVNDLSTAIQPLRARFQGYMTLQLHENALIVLYALTNQTIMNLIEAGLNPEDEALKELIIELENDWKALVEVYTLSQKTSLAMEQAEKDKLKKLNKMVADSEKSSSRTEVLAQKATDRVLTSKNTQNVGKKGKKLAALQQEMDEEAEMDEYIPQVEAPMTLMKIFEQLANWRQQLQVMGPIFGDALRVLKLRVIADTEKQKEAAKAAGSVTTTATTSANNSATEIPEAAPKEGDEKQEVAAVKSKKILPTGTKKSISGTVQGALKRKGLAQPGALKKAKRQP